MSVAQVMEFICGKSVAIVGNAQSIFETDNGEKWNLIFKNSELK